MQKIAIYARVSSERQEKENTIKSQLETLREYAQENSFIIYDEYTDEGYSGELLARPALDKLRDDAKNKLIGAILIHSPDRLSRKFIHSGLIEEELAKNNIKIIYLNRPDSKNTPEDMLLNGMQGLIAEYEKAKILERTRRGKLSKAKGNKIVGSIAPYGYTYVKGDKAIGKSGYYVINEDEAKIVKLIFALFLDKQLSIRGIAKELTKQEIKPRKGKEWRTSALHKILRNETYTGTTYYNKHISVETDNRRDDGKYRRIKNTGRQLRPQDEWIAIKLPDSNIIIEKSLFESAQRQLKRNSELSSRNTKHHYLLRGLVTCGNCGAPYHGTPMHGKLYYRCGNRDRTFPRPQECRVPTIKADRIESIVWNKFQEAISNPDLIKSQIPALEDKANQKSKSVDKDIESININIKKAKDEETRLIKAYREDIITLDQLKEQNKLVHDKICMLEQEKAELVKRQGSDVSYALLSKNIDYYCKVVAKRLEEINGDFDSKRYLLTLGVNNILLEGNTVTIKGIIPSDSNTSCPENVALRTQYLNGGASRVG